MSKSAKEKQIMNGGNEKDDSEQVGLKASMTLFDAIMLGVGCIIGSGIFVSTRGVHENAGSVGLSLIVWLVSGLFSALGAYCYAELGTLITKSGGDYAYVFVAFGNFLGFVRLWMESLIIRPCTLAAVAIIFANNVLQPFFPCKSPEHAPQLMAAGCLALLALVNAFSLKLTTWIQNVFTLGKLFALGLIICTGFYLLFSRSGDELEAFNNMFETSNWDFAKLSLALYSGLWSFNGFNYLTIVTEELQNPRRNLPLAIGLTCLICTVVYVLANVAFYAGVTLDEVVDSNAVAVTFAEHHYGIFAFIMPIVVAMSCFGTVNGVLMTSSRLFYCGARENQMPNVLCMINPYFGTPMPSVFFTLLLSFGYLTMSKNIYSLINSIQVVNWIGIAMAAAALIWLRKKMPVDHFPRPVKVNLIIPITFLIGCIYLVVVPTYVEPGDSLKGLGLMLSSLLVYFPCIYWKNKPACLTGVINSVTLACQKLMLVVEEKKSA